MLLLLLLLHAARVYRSVRLRDRRVDDSCGACQGVTVLRKAMRLVMKANVASLQQSRRHSLEVAKTNEAPPKTAAAPRDVDI